MKSIHLPHPASQWSRLENLKYVISHYSFTFTSERDMKDQFEQLLRREQIPFEREPRLSPLNRPDFILLGDIAVEAKVGGGMNGHLRQLKRYADEPAIKAVVLIGTRPYQLPELLSAKPCLCLRLRTLA
jgi:hypothetical protein